ncbi:hypothetical protein BDB01DRAFT_838186 [Pilobolus umbonatus]|nr:hypothetical protein BDB01DRAFT_838186 [Pilobolus umbonatus]
MNDYSYPVTSKDMSKDTSYYSSDIPRFNRSSPVHSRTSYQGTINDYEQWHSNMPSNTSSVMSPATCDLQDIIIYYQSQPELLRLILLSKVEEDKRRTEEAKLRAKELDLILIQQQHQFTESIDNSSLINIPSSHTLTNSNLVEHTNHSNNNKQYNNKDYENTPSPNIRKNTMDPLIEDNNNTMPRRDSALGSSFTGSANSDELEDHHFSPNNSTNNSILSMSFNQPMISMSTPRNSLYPSPAYNANPSQPLTDPSFSAQIKLETKQSPDQTRFDPYLAQRPRRRREMQAITKIVETRDYPYMDGYFWKNNGNTIQKKTGNKSVYYKCSNSTKGCPVNKTVTWRDNGEYLIKYRGDHLSDCGKVQRIVDM